MPEATHKVTGVTITADEAVIRRLGSEWQIQGPEKKPAPKGKDKK